MGKTLLQQKAEDILLRTIEVIEKHEKKTGVPPDEIIAGEEVFQTMEDWDRYSVRREETTEGRRTIYGIPIRIDYEQKNLIAAATTTKTYLSRALPCKKRFTGICMEATSEWAGDQVGENQCNYCNRYTL